METGTSGDEHASLSLYNCKKFCISCPDSKNVHLVSTIRQFFKKFELRDKNIHSSSLSYKAFLPVFSMWLDSNPGTLDNKSIGLPLRHRNWPINPITVP